MLAGFQSRNAHPTVVGNQGVDVHRVDLGVFKQLLKIRVPRLDSEGIPHGIQLFPIALADGVQVGVGMVLVDRDKFRTETETDDSDIDFFARHRGVL